MRTNLVLKIVKPGEKPRFDVLGYCSEQIARHVASKVLSREPSARVEVYGQDPRKVRGIDPMSVLST